MTVVRSQIGRFAMVPSWVRRALRGQSRALELYVLLAEIMDYPDLDAGETDGSIQRTRKWLAGELDCSPDTVDRAVGVLAVVGALTVEHQHGPEGNYVASVYTVRQVPSEVAEPATTDGEDRQDPVEGGGRTDAATSPHGCPEVSAPVPRGVGTDAESIPDTSFHTPSTREPQADAANGAAPGVTDNDPAPSSRKDPSHPNYAASFDVMAAAFGLCDPGTEAKGLPVAARNSINRARKGAFRAGLLDDLGNLADAIWVYRARPQCDIGTFAAAAADIALNPDTVRLVAHRREAALLVAEACAKLGLGPAGRATSQPAAEVAVARLLDADVSADRVVSALRAADGWTHGQLQTELSRQRPQDRPAFPAAPADLGPVLTLDLIGLLRRGLPPMDVPRVAAEIQDRADRLNERQRERVHDELTSGAFCEVNQIPTYVRALIKRYAPVDAAREAARAADRAAWEVGPTEQLALSAGGGS